MNTKLVKRMLAATLAATFMFATVVTAGATTQSSEGSSSGSSSTPAPASIAAETSTISVGGAVIKTQLPGSYYIPASSAIAGVAVRQSAATIRAALGLAGNQTPYVRAFEITSAKSPAAWASFQAAANGLGAVVLGAVNIDLGAMTGGKFSSLPATAQVPTTIGVKNANGRTLAVVKVLPGGATEILQDTDDNPNTVTFNIGGGLAAYAVIAY